MARFIPPSIQSYNGIKGYLDATKEHHNGYGYDDLIRNRPSRSPGGRLVGLNLTNLARLFGVSRPTIQDWLERVDTEHKKSKKK